MSITNNRSSSIRTFITDVNCMYDNGEEDSNLSVFNNALIAGNTTYPEPSQYIEAKNSGDCWAVTSTFTLKIVDETSHTDIGKVDFTENDGYGGTSSNPDVIDVDIDNSGDTATISVTVEET
ncbi:hypothetical protein [Streptomyces rimosus]|uniref:hypothetical protein n=1 Tax=Streptomyces rimosus TaxID=1927 RepID=UPI003792E215